jgi:serine/threonine-protein kinase
VLSAGPEIIEVPNVLGRDEATAESILRGAGFFPVVRRAYDAAPAGKVFAQSPDPNTPFQKGAKVHISVSRGPPPVTIPTNLIGQPKDEATSTLEGLGLQVDTVEGFSTKIPAGDVAKVSPPGGTSVQAGSTVTLTISKGPKRFAMPDVRGETKEQAVAQLEADGLTVNVVPVPSIVPPDTVVFQDPQPGTIVQQGDTVTIYVTGTQ